MGAFEYTALDTRGRNIKGVLEGDTPRQIRQQLRDKGWSPLSVEEVADGTAGGEKGATGSRRFRLSPTDLALVTRQIATLVRAALPVEEALRAAAQQTEKPRVKSLILGVRARVLEGHTLADGLTQFPAAFPDLYRMTVAAGEQSGQLDRVLERLADYTEARQQLRQRIQLALLYPALLTVVAILVVVGLITYVVPQVVSVFVNVGQELPLLTRGLIALSDFLVDWGVALLILLALASAGVAWLLRRPHIRLRWHRILLKLPLIGRLSRGLNTARFARTLSILAASGVPILDSLHVAGQVVSNLPMRNAVEEAAARVREGAGLARSLERAGHFSPMTIHLIASGEQSGQLEAMLERAATNQEREMETLVSALLGIFEPLLILVMGGIVLMIVLAILLPIFNLNQLVK